MIEIKKYEAKWKHLGKLLKNPDEVNLLRRVLLRDLLEQAHADQSRALAHGQENLVEEKRKTENRIHFLTNLKNLDQPLLELLENADLGKEEKIKTTPSPFKSLERMDRKLEKILAFEAIQCGWEFWILKATLPISTIENWHKNLIKTLWPQGILLYTESDPNQKITPNFWHGRWFAALNPKFSKPELGVWERMTIINHTLLQT